MNRHNGHFGQCEFGKRITITRTVKNTLLENISFITVRFMVGKGENKLGSNTIKRIRNNLKKLYQHLHSLPVFIENNFTSTALAKLK